MARGRADLASHLPVVVFCCMLLLQAELQVRVFDFSEDFREQIVVHFREQIFVKNEINFCENAKRKFLFNRVSYRLSNLDFFECRHKIIILQNGKR